MKKMRSWLQNQSRSTQGEVLILCLFFIIFTLGQLSRISISPQISFYAHDLLVFVWLLLHLRLLVRLVRNAAHWLTKHPLIAATVVWIIVGVIWSNFQQLQLRPLLILLRLMAYILFACTVSVFFQGQRIALRSILVITGNLMLWLGLLQYLFIPDTRFLYILGWDDHYFRLIGPLLDPNFMGMMIILTSIFTVSVHWLLPKKAQILLQAYYAALLALTYSRASFATAGLSALLLAATPYPLKGWRIRHRIILAISTVVVFSLTLLVAPKPGGEGVRLFRTSSIAARQSTATQSIQNLSYLDLALGKGLFVNPLTYDASESAGLPQHAQVPDNILLLLLTGTGIIGTVLILSSTVYWIGSLATQETAIAIAVAATVLHAQFNNTLFEPFISLFLLLAICAPLRSEMHTVATKKPFRHKRKPGVQ